MQVFTLVLPISIGDTIRKILEIYGSFRPARMRACSADFHVFPRAIIPEDSYHTHSKDVGPRFVSHQDACDEAKRKRGLAGENPPLSLRDLTAATMRPR